MIATGSYDVRSFAIDQDAEIARLDAQVDLFWPREAALYRRLGLSAGMAVLDCGCGTGRLLVRLHEEFPGLRCFGIDVDAELAGCAARRAGRVHPPAFAAARQSILNLEFPGDTFDFAVARLVLEHLPDPVAAAREVLRVLKPGGTAVFLANDFDFHLRTWPACPALEELYEAYRAARRRDGGNPCLGRQLPAVLANAGFGEVTLEVLSAHSRQAGDAAFLKAEGAGIPARMVASGQLAPDVLDRLAHQWRAMLAAPDHCMIRILFAAAAKKDAASRGGSTFSVEDRAASRSGVAPEAPSSDPPGAAAGDGVLRLVVAALAREMNVSPSLLDPGRSLIQLGGDSLAAVGLCDTLHERLGVRLPVSEILSDKPLREVAATVRELAPAAGRPPMEAA